MPQLFLLPQAVAILKQLPLIIFDKCPSNRPYTQPDYGNLMPFLTQTIIVKNLSSPYYMSKKCAKYTYMYVNTHSHLILIKTFEVCVLYSLFSKRGLHFRNFRYLPKVNSSPLSYLECSSHHLDSQPSKLLLSLQETRFRYHLFQQTFSAIPISDLLLAKAKSCLPLSLCNYLFICLFTSLCLPAF